MAAYFVFGPTNYMSSPFFPLLYDLEGSVTIIVKSLAQSNNAGSRLSMSASAARLASSSAAIS